MGHWINDPLWTFWFGFLSGQLLAWVLALMIIYPTKRPTP